MDDDLEGGKTCGRNVQLLIEDYLEAYPETNIYYFQLHVAQEHLLQNGIAMKEAILI